MVHHIEVDNSIILGIFAGQALRIGLHSSKSQFTKPRHAFLQVLGYHVATDLPPIRRENRARHIAITRADFKKVLILSIAERIVKELDISWNHKQIADIANELFGPGDILAIDQ